VIEPIGKGAFGFDDTAVIIGESFARHADTPAMIAGKEIEKLLMGADTLGDAEAARKEKRLAFDGSLDPWKHMDHAIEQAPAYLPRRGVELETAAPGVIANRSLDTPAAIAIEARSLNLVQLASRCAGAMPGEWTAAHYQQLAAWHPAGALETEVAAIVDRLKGFTEPPRLRAVGGA